MIFGSGADGQEDLGRGWMPILGFSFTNGIHDASNAIAALVATRAATPLQAVLLAAVFNLLGPLLLGAAVADTIGGIISVGGSTAIEIIGAGCSRPCRGTSDVAVGAVELGARARRRPGRRRPGRERRRRDQLGGLDGSRPVGVFGIADRPARLAAGGGLAALLVIRGLRSAARRATQRWSGDGGGGQWAMSGGSRSATAPTTRRSRSASSRRSCSPAGHSQHVLFPVWTKVVVRRRAHARHGARRVADRADGRAADSTGSIRTDGLATEVSSAGVIFGSSLLGAPVSTTQVVASSVVGVGAGAGVGVTCTGRSSGTWVSPG